MDATELWKSKRLDLFGELYIEVLLVIIVVLCVHR